MPNVIYERMLATGDYVACKQCAHPISRRRAECAISHGLCTDCNAPTLTHSRDVKEREPQYETRQGERARARAS